MTCLLLTGSRGLIGNSLAEYLYQQAIPFKPFDLRFPLGHPGEGDVLDKVALKKAMEGCTGVIHLAGTSRVILGQKDPALCLAHNVEGTTNIIEALLESPYKPWLIYASSREVYGQQETLPVCEDAVLNPMNVYAHSKVAAEKKVLEARQSGISTAILRFSNVFGSPFDYPDRVIPAFCRAALSAESLRGEGGDNVFDFTFVDDVARGIAKVVDVLMTNPQNLPPIHFTTGRGISLSEAARTIVRMTNSSSHIKEADPRSFDVGQFYGDPSRAKSLLGWSSHFSFEEALGKFLPNLKEHLQEEQFALKRVAS